MCTEEEEACWANTLSGTSPQKLPMRDKFFFPCFFPCPCRHIFPRRSGRWVCFGIIHNTQSRNFRQLSIHDGCSVHQHCFKSVNNTVCFKLWMFFLSLNQSSWRYCATSTCRRVPLYFNVRTIAQCAVTKLNVVTLFPAVNYEANKTQHSVTLRSRSDPLDLLSPCKIHFSCMFSSEQTPIARLDTGELACFSHSLLSWLFGPQTAPHCKL